MRIVALPVVALLCLNAGCVTAARKIEQAIRRGTGDDTKAGQPQLADLPPTAPPDFAVRPGHPKLFLTDDWPAAPDSTARNWQAILRKRADALIAAAAIDYSGSKLLTRSREALKRLSLFGAVYRFSKEARYADAGRRELLNVCGFPNWQPNDFLATAEMMNAAAIGYDWLYDTLSPAERRQVAAAIVQKGLRAAVNDYRSQGGWTRAQHNWNLVCNGGVIVASLAVYDEQPDAARQCLTLAMQSIRYGLSAYGPDGGTAEGPMYHSYATRYLAFAAAALETAPTRPVTLTPDKSWQHAGDYRLAMTGPTGVSANFGDSGDVLGNTAWMFWLARETHDAKYAAFETADDSSEPSAFDLLWYTPAPTGTPRMLPGPRRFGSAVVLRPPGDDPLAPFVAVRTGSTGDHHSHLDLGNFVFDVLGQRFAQDLGPDNYNLAGYMGPRRADYLRTSTPGHNTLTIGDASQPDDTSCRVEVAGTPGGKQTARVEMKDAYPGFKTAARTFTLDGRTLTVHDDLRADRSARVTWHLHTAATVTVTGNTATLDNHGQRVTLTVVSPAGVRLTAEPDATDPPQQPVDHSTHVYFKVKVDDKTNIDVRFEPTPQ